MKKLVSKISITLGALALAGTVMAQDPAPPSPGTANIDKDFNSLIGVVTQGFHTVTLNSQAFNANLMGVFSPSSIPTQIASTAALFTEMAKLQPLVDTETQLLANKLAVGDLLLSDSDQKAVDCSNAACTNFNLLLMPGTYTPAQTLQAKTLLQNLNDPQANGLIPLTDQTKQDAAKGDAKAQALIAMSKYTNTMQSLPMRVYTQSYSNHMAMEGDESLSSLQSKINEAFGGQSITKALADTNVLSMIFIKLSEMANYLHQIANETEALQQSNLLQAANTQNTLIMIRLLARMTYSPPGSADDAQVGNLKQQAQDQDKNQNQQPPQS